jgi:hypothetical protein
MISLHDNLKKTLFISASLQKRKLYDQTMQKSCQSIETNFGCE